MVIACFIAPPRSWFRTLAGFLVMLFAPLLVMLVITFCRGVRRRGRPRAVALRYGSLVLALFGYVGDSMFVQMSAEHLNLVQVRASDGSTY